MLFQNFLKNKKIPSGEKFISSKERLLRAVERKAYDILAGIAKGNPAKRLHLFQIGTLRHFAFF